MTRRAFTASFPLAAAACLLPRAARAATKQDVFTNASLGAYSQGILTQAHFKSLIGTLFMAFLDDGAVSYLRLHTVEETVAKPNKNSTTSFHLSFKTDGRVLKQDTYLLDHGTLGRFALFLVPGQLPSGAPSMGAIFSSLASTSMSRPPQPRPGIALLD